MKKFPLMVAVFNKFFVFLIIPLILSIGIAPVLPFVDAVSEPDDFTCRDGQAKVRNLQHGYLRCMEPSKADRFVQLGLVELVSEASEETMEETMDEEPVELSEEIEATESIEEKSMDKVMMEPEIRKDEVETELETPSPASTQEFEPAPALPTAVRINPFYWSANGFGIDILRSFNLPIDPYLTPGVSENSSDEEIKEAYLEENLDNTQRIIVADDQRAQTYVVHFSGGEIKETKTFTTFSRFVHLSPSIEDLRTRSTTLEHPQFILESLPSKDKAEYYNFIGDIINGDTYTPFDVSVDIIAGDGTIMQTWQYDDCEVTEYVLLLQENKIIFGFNGKFIPELRDKTKFGCNGFLFFGDQTPELQDSVKTISSTSLETIVPEKILVQCKEGEILIHHTIHGYELCIDESTAKLWIELEMAEIVVEEIEEIEPETEEIIFQPTRIIPEDFIPNDDERGQIIAVTFSGGEFEGEKTFILNYKFTPYVVVSKTVNVETNAHYHVPVSSTVDSPSGSPEETCSVSIATQPDDPGKPDDPGQPGDPGKPDDPGKPPDSPGQGPPEDPEEPDIPCEPPEDELPITDPTEAELYYAKTVPVSIPVTTSAHVPGYGIGELPQFSLESLASKDKQGIYQVVSDIMNGRTVGGVFEPFDVKVDIITGDGTILQTWDYDDCDLLDFTTQLQDSVLIYKMTNQFPPEIRDKSTFSCKGFWFYAEQKPSDITQKETINPIDFIPSEQDRAHKYIVHFSGGEIKETKTFTTFPKFTHLAPSISDVTESFTQAAHPQFVLESLPSKDKTIMYKAISDIINGDPFEPFDATVDVISGDNTIIQSYKYTDCQITGYWTYLSDDLIYQKFAKPFNKEIRDKLSFDCAGFLFYADQSEFVLDSSVPEPVTKKIDVKTSDIECRVGFISVFRINSNNFACVTEPTSQRWIELGIAMKIDEPETEVIEEVAVIVPEINYVPTDEDRGLIYVVHASGGEFPETVTFTYTANFTPDNPLDESPIFTLESLSNKNKNGMYQYVSKIINGDPYELFDVTVDIVTGDGTILQSWIYTKCDIVNFVPYSNDSLLFLKYHDGGDAEINDRTTLRCNGLFIDAEQRQSSVIEQGIINPIDFIPSDQDRAQKYVVHFYDGRIGETTTFTTFSKYTHVNPTNIVLPKPGNTINLPGYKVHPQLILSSLTSNDKSEMYEAIGKTINEQQLVQLFDISVDIVAGDGTIIQTWTYDECELQNYVNALQHSILFLPFSKEFGYEIRESSLLSCLGLLLDAEQRPSDITDKDTVRQIDFIPRIDDSAQKYVVHFSGGEIPETKTFTTFSHFTPIVKNNEIPISIPNNPIGSSPRFLLESLPSNDKAIIYKAISKIINGDRIYKLFDISIDILTGDDTILQTWSYTNCDITDYFSSFEDSLARIKYHDKYQGEIVDVTIFSCNGLHFSPPF